MRRERGCESGRCDEVTEFENDVWICMRLEDSVHKVGAFEYPRVFISGIDFGFNWVDISISPFGPLIEYIYPSRWLVIHFLYEC